MSDTPWIVRGTDLQDSLTELYCESVRARVLGLALEDREGYVICPDVGDISAWWAVKFMQGREGRFDKYANYLPLGDDLTDWPELGHCPIFLAGMTVSQYIESRQR